MKTYEKTCKNHMKTYKTYKNIFRPRNIHLQVWEINADQIGASGGPYLVWFWQFDFCSTDEEILGTMRGEYLGTRHGEYGG